MKTLSEGFVSRSAAHLILTLLGLVVTVALPAQSKYEKEFAAIDTTGKVLFKFYAKSAYAFENGIARVRKYVVQGGSAYYRYGAINEKGSLVIPAVWDKLRDFKTDVTFARKPGDKTYYLIDKNGLPVTQKQFSSPGYFFEGLAKFKEGEKYGFVDSTGAVVVEPKFISVSFCSEGLICVAEDGPEERYYFIDKLGNKAFDKSYRQAGTTSFHQGLARVKMSGKTGLIDHAGQIVVTPKFSTVSGFGDSLLTVSQGKSFDDFGYANFNNEIVIPGPYYSAESFKNGYASVKNNDMKSGIINRRGETIIPFKYDATYNALERDGYFSAYIGKEWFYFDEQGNDFTNLDVKVIMRRGEGKLCPYQDAKTKKWGYLNSKGEMVIAPQFIKCQPFGANGIGIVQLTE